MRNQRPLAALLLLLLFSIALPVSSADGDACGSGGRCEIEGGYYLAAAPPDWDGHSALPLVVFFHGWNASPEGMMRNRAMVNSVHARGALFVLPFAQTGYWRQIGTGRAEGGRDELAYVQALMRDVRQRWPLRPRASIASGFSRGASMVWNVACYAGDLFHAYVPIAGGFWGSTPPTCPTGPMNLRHIHGLKDRVVAFDAIGIYNSMPITEGFTMLRELNRCETRAPNSNREHRRYRCDIWSSCASGAELQLCLHPRGHSIPAEWVAEGLDWALTLDD